MDALLARVLRLSIALCLAGCGGSTPVRGAIDDALEAMDDPDEGRVLTSQTIAEAMACRRSDVEQCEKLADRVQAAAPSDARTIRKHACANGSAAACKDLGAKP